MVRNILRTFLFLMLGTVLVSCAAPGLLNKVKPGTVPTGGYVQNVENFMVILDASGSMLDQYEGERKLQLARENVSLFNRTIPEMELTGALRTFGQSHNPFASGTALVYGLAPYSRDGFQKALEPVWGGGPSPMSNAIKAADGDFDSASGRIALIVFSDGEEMDEIPVASAKRMKNRYGERLCIYTVLVGDDPAGKAIMDGVADSGDCGFSVTLGSVSTSDGMADFVKRVFFDEDLRPVDSDGDGVYDSSDECPGTPKGSTVNEVGCRGDRDGDGVFDDDDRCPHTLKAATVNEVGCWILKGLRFDTAKWDIKSRYHPLLDELVVILDNNPSLRIEIQGHTDSRGSVELNRTLSEKRAGSVMSYLVGKGIAQGRLTAKGFGFANPVATNDTQEGMAQNRRVELKPLR